MKITKFFDFDKCILSNDLWPKFINKIGLSKAQLAVRQSLDLQNMQGTSFTLPVLILETCGSALVSSEAVRNHIGFSNRQQGILLIYSSKLNSIQLLQGN